MHSLSVAATSYEECSQPESLVAVTTAAGPGVTAGVTVHSQAVRLRGDTVLRPGQSTLLTYERSRPEPCGRSSVVTAVETLCRLRFCPQMRATWSLFKVARSNRVRPLVVFACLCSLVCSLLLVGGFHPHVFVTSRKSNNLASATHHETLRNSLLSLPAAKDFAEPLAAALRSYESGDPLAAERILFAGQCHPGVSPLARGPCTFVVLSTDASAASLYAESAVPTSAMWRRLGVQPIIIVGSSNWQNETTKRTLQLLRLFGAITLCIDPRDVRPASTGTRFTTALQVARLVSAHLSWLRPDDVLLTSDADIWPMSPNFWRRWLKGAGAITGPLSRSDGNNQRAAGHGSMGAGSAEHQDSSASPIDSERIQHAPEGIVAQPETTSKHGDTHWRSSPSATRFHIYNGLFFDERMAANDDDFVAITVLAAPVSLWRRMISQWLQRRGSRAYDDLKTALASEPSAEQAAAPGLHANVSPPNLVTASNAASMAARSPSASASAPPFHRDSDELISPLNLLGIFLGAGIVDVGLSTWRENYHIPGTLAPPQWSWDQRLVGQWIDSTTVCRPPLGCEINRDVRRLDRKNWSYRWDSHWFWRLVRWAALAQSPDIDEFTDAHLHRRSLVEERVWQMQREAWAAAFGDDVILARYRELLVRARKADASGAASPTLSHATILGSVTVTARPDAHQAAATVVTETCSVW